MFQSARLKLTAWYLTIIMLISISFSIFVYKQIIFEVRRSLRSHALKVIPQLDFSLPFSISVKSLEVDINQIYEEVRQKILLELFCVNTGIFVLAGLSGYFLAGKTLRPIEEMVDDQKRFIADASHELRTPLTAMKTEIEVALRDKDLALNEAKLLLKSNLEEVDHMQTLANYLLTLSKYHNDSGASTLAPMELAPAIEKAIMQQEFHAKQKNIRIESSVQNSRVYGNLVSITELVTILLDNAIKYSPNNSRVIVRQKKKGKCAILEVEDFGVGIKESELPYIFNRFYRADSSRSKTEIEGYGLGLSIAKKIVSVHNGKIDVTSTPNHGTTFTVTLPITGD